MWFMKGVRQVATKKSVEEWVAKIRDLDAEINGGKLSKAMLKKKRDLRYQSVRRAKKLGATDEQILAASEVVPATAASKVEGNGFFDRAFVDLVAEKVAARVAERFSL
jgi:hypothetical protein